MVECHDGNRTLQDRFDTRRLADRLNDVVAHDAISQHDRRFIERADMFFLATADEQGRPNCSYKGGDPGFVRVLDEHTLAFPNYDGSGMYLSMGNLLRNHAVGMLFIDFEKGNRMRVNGDASIDDNDPLMAAHARGPRSARQHGGHGRGYRETSRLRLRGSVQPCVQAGSRPIAKPVARQPLGRLTDGGRSGGYAARSSLLSR